MRAWTAILVVVTAGACGKHATCEDAVDHMLSLMLKEAPADRHEKIKQQRDKQVEQCKQEKPSQALLDCAAKIAKLDDIRDCVAIGSGKGKDAAGIFKEHETE